MVTVPNMYCFSKISRTPMGYKRDVKKGPLKPSLRNGFKPSEVGTKIELRVISEVLCFVGADVCDC